MDCGVAGLAGQNNELRRQLQTLTQESHRKDAVNAALKASLSNYHHRIREAAAAVPGALPGAADSLLLCLLPVAGGVGP